LISSTNSGSDGRKGFAAPNVFKALGCLVDVSILGPSTVNSGSNYTLTVHTAGAESYQWNGSETSHSISNTGGAPGTCRTHRLQSPRSRQPRRSASKNVCVPGTPVTPLCSAEMRKRCLSDPDPRTANANLHSRRRFVHVIARVGLDGATSGPWRMSTGSPRRERE
jgi:hypothetical protein